MQTQKDERESPLIIFKITQLFMTASDALRGGGGCQGCREARLTLGKVLLMIDLRFKLILKEIKLGPYHQRGSKNTSRV